MKHKPLPHQRYCWCLDNGHGKLQKGKRSPIFDDGRQFLEYEFNRDIVVRIMQRLDELCVNYFDVVPDVYQVGSFLKGRVIRANAKQSIHPKILLSIHANGHGDGKRWTPAHGIETWYFEGSQQGKTIANIFQKHLVEETGWRDRGLKHTGMKNLYVLRKTKMPAILTENDFFTNKEKAKELMKKEVRQTIAEAHVNAIMHIEKNGI